MNKLNYNKILKFFKSLFKVSSDACKARPNHVKSKRGHK